MPKETLDHNEKFHIRLLKQMITIRCFEQGIKTIFGNNPAAHYVHLSIGQEAISVGAMNTINKNDYITVTYRNHGHLIAKGASIEKMAAEIFHHKNGYCCGHGGSMHLAVPSLKIIDANGIVGAGIPIAAGAALSLSLKKSKNVVLCFFGDGAANQGVFHETLNISSLWKLPIIFICENNGYAMKNKFKNSIATANISGRAKGYGMPGVSVNGNDVLLVSKAIERAVKNARQGLGPSLIECLTCCLSGHHADDDLSYRSSEEIKLQKLRDPIVLFRNKLIRKKIITCREYYSIQKRIDSLVEKKILKQYEKPKKSS